ncbi:MAG: TonB-dependent receptor [Novosphingobium sp.]
MKYLFLLGCSFVASAPVLAAESSEIIIADRRVSDDAITVVATGNKVMLATTGQSITVIGQDEIDSIQGADLARVLERAPGVTLTRNGGLGTFTGLRVRGADAEQLLVLVDGVRVADVAAPGGGFDIGNVMAGQVGKVELLRGSNSVVWGSHAIGGVLALTTRTVDGAAVSAEYGSQNTVTVEGSAGKIGSGYELGLTAGYVRSDGVSAAAVGTEADGYRQWHVNGRGKVELAPGLSAIATARYADSRLEIDGYPAPFYNFADTPEYQTTREASGRAGLDYQGDRFSLTGGFALSDTRRSYFNTPASAAPNNQTFGRTERADLSGHADLPMNLTLDFGADSEWTRYHSTFDAQAKARLSSGHALLGLHSGGLNLSGGVRVDDHSRFGTHWTLGANGSYEIAPNLRLRASYGEGFKAPTLFQLLSNYGNTKLRPETSRSYDAGIELGERSDPLHFAATVFRRDSSDLIDFVGCASLGLCATRPFGTYDNVKRARAEGFELEGDVRPTTAFTIHAAYSYVRAVNRSTGKDLVRRPRHALSLAADWTTPVAGLAIGGDVRLVSDSFDDAGNFTRMDGYVLAAVRASLPVTARIELFGRVENLGNVHYQTAAGYGTPGRSAFVGARAKF